MLSAGDFFFPKPLPTPEKNSTPTILTSLTIELECGKYEIIDIYAEDEPAKLAHNFLIKHKIDLKILDLLTRNIADAQQKANNENPQFLDNRKKISKSFSEQYPSIYFQNLPYFE